MIVLTLTNKRNEFLFYDRLHRIIQAGLIHKNGNNKYRLTSFG
jgi:hypothetical protein